MPKTLSWVGPMLVLTTLVAQQGPPPDPKPAASPPAAERFAALQAEYKTLMTEHQAKLREAQTKAKEAQAAGSKTMPAMPMRPDTGPLLEQALAAASDYAGTDDAVQFLVFATRNSGGKKDAATRALDELTSKHVDHPAIAELGQFIAFVPRLIGDEKTASVFLDRLSKSANADVRGWAAFARHEKTIETAERDADAYKTARAELQKAGEAAASEQLKDQIRSAIETREKYGVGNTAPDIEGTDLDGVAFKLSDYKGKVVFLDFWGDW